MSTVRKTLYERLPEIYHIKDDEQKPSHQLKAYLDILDKIQAGIRDNIEALYHDFFIETCHDWVIPYIADLLGTSHLAGHPWNLRADVARTVKHRRRKGTLGAIESLTFALSGWAVHSVELFQRVVWNQQLNHQRPDEGGLPPIPINIDKSGYIGGAVRGGTVTLRDPALLSFYDGPFDPFAHVVDVKPLNIGTIRYNIPNLAIFLWRLKDYTVPITKPVLYEDTIIDQTAAAGPDEAKFVLRYDIHALAEPMVLFNTHRFDENAEPPNLTTMDAVPGPMPRARLRAGTPTGKPEAYVAIDLYDPDPRRPGDDSVGLILHMPAANFGAVDWAFRGANLCAWHEGLNPTLNEHEIVIDPEHGRLMVGVGGAAVNEQAEPLDNGIFVSAAYGFSGPTGAHPIARGSAPDNEIKVNYDSFTDESGATHAAANGTGLRDALNDIHTKTNPTVIEIDDSRVYELNIGAITGIDEELGIKVLRLANSLHIRAASLERPIIKLTRPFAFRPNDLTDPVVDNLNVKLEGLYITWDHDSTDFDADTPLIARAALNELIIEDCTLDPGCHETLNGTRQPIRYAMRLTNDNGFDTTAEQEAFEQTPEISFKRSICGPLAIDTDYKLSLAYAIVDAASGVQDKPASLSVHAATGDPETEWGPALTVSGMTCFGRMRVDSATGEGGVWVHRLEVHDPQKGCIKFSYFSGDSDKLPQHQGCVFGTHVVLSFTSEVFGQAGYAQLHLRSDRKVLEQGPKRDAMGAFGYLLNTHKWKNINIRFREFMPVGVRALLIPVT